MSAPVPLSHGPIWSLWEIMQRENAERYLTLGQRINDVLAVWALDKYCGEDGRLNDDGKKELLLELTLLEGMADRLDLPVSKTLISDRIKGEAPVPDIQDGFNMIVEVVKSELKNKLFLFVPSHLATFYGKKDLLTVGAKEAFPSAVAELRSAGNAYAVELPVAAVFYAMRALEHGLRALAQDVGRTFDVQQWYGILGEIESVIAGYRDNGIPNMSKDDKNARLKFLSESSIQFSYFKDGWRNYVSHAKGPYSNQQALTVINHVAAFFEILAQNIKEA